MLKKGQSSFAVFADGARCHNGYRRQRRRDKHQHSPNLCRDGLRRRRNAEVRLGSVCDYDGSDEPLEPVPDLPTDFQHFFVVQRLR